MDMSTQTDVQDYLCANLSRISQGNLPESEVFSEQITQVYNFMSLLNRLSTEQRISAVLHAISSPSSRIWTVLRSSGCIQMLLGIVHAERSADGQADSNDVRNRYKAEQALLHVIDRCGSTTERHVCHILSEMRSVSKSVGGFRGSAVNTTNNGKCPCNEALLSTYVLTCLKLSFSEQYRQSLCLLGATETTLQILAEHCDKVKTPQSVTIMCYGCLLLTNLTIDSDVRRRLVCQAKHVLESILTTLDELSGDKSVELAVGSLLRNLSYQASPEIRTSLRAVDTAERTCRAFTRSTSQPAQTIFLSVLNNLSTDYDEEQVYEAVCGVDGFLRNFLFQLDQAKSTMQLEIYTGLLKNLSAYISCSSRYMKILRLTNVHNCLIGLLSSDSESLVANICVTLWNASAHSRSFQQFLSKRKVLPLLTRLKMSRNRTIASCSKALCQMLVEQPSINLGRLGQVESMPMLPTKLDCETADFNASDLTLNQQEDITRASESTLPSVRYKKPLPVAKSPDSQSRVSLSKVYDVLDEDLTRNSPVLRPNVAGSCRENTSSVIPPVKTSVKPVISGLKKVTMLPKMVSEAKSGSVKATRFDLQQRTPLAVDSANKGFMNRFRLSQETPQNVRRVESPAKLKVSLPRTTTCKQIAGTGGGHSESRALNGHHGSAQPYAKFPETNPTHHGRSAKQDDSKLSRLPKAVISNKSLLQRAISHNEVNQPESKSRYSKLPSIPVCKEIPLQRQVLWRGRPSQTVTQTR